VWIARIIVTWGLVASMMAFVNGTAMFYSLRFVLGAAEAGFFPGVIFYLTRWSMAGVIGAPVSSALLRLEGAWGLHGWQWLFIIEGLPAVILAPVVLGYLTERPQDAAWLTPDERSALAREIAIEQAQTTGSHVAFVDAVGSRRLWALSVLYFCLVLAIYGVSFWLPQIVQAAGTLSSSTVVLLSAIPYLIAALGMVIIGAHSDRTGERRWHVAGPALIGASGFILTVLAPSTVATSLATLSIAALGIWGTLGPFWTMPPAFLRGTAAAGGIAVVNSVGNLGGFMGPFFVGYVRDVTGSFAGGLLALAAGLVIAALIALVVGERSR
jgi:ACS family tartrate transporter-like MFS transporter